MMKLVVIGGALFLLSLAGTTGTLVMTQRTALAAAPADSTGAHGDSAAAHAPANAGDASTHAADAGAASRTPDSSVSTAASASTAAANDIASGAPERAGTASVPVGSPAASSTAAPASPSAVPATAAPNATVSKPDSDSPHGFRQLARIFSNMKAADAAKVMAYMSDEEVHGVLQQLGVRQAASLLGTLPKERAAALSRRVLAGDATP